MPIPYSVLAAISLLALPAVSCREPVAASQTSSRSDRPLVVESVRPQREQLERSLELAASVDAFEKATLFAKISGYLREIRVDRGDRVTQSQLLAVLDIPETRQEVESARAQVRETEALVAQTESDRNQAEAEFRLQDLTAKRVRDVHKEEAELIPQQEVDAAEANAEVARAKLEAAANKIKLASARLETARANLGRTEALLEYARIVAPFSGVVTARYVDRGALIQAATSSQTQAAPLVTVMNLDSVRVQCDVPEKDVVWVRVGMPIRFRLDALPGREFRGHITRITTVLDPSTRTMRAEVEHANPGHQIRPGMYGRITLLLETRRGALTLPAEALVVEKSRKYIFVVENGKARRVEVETGVDTGTRVEIVRGLQGSEEVVVAGRSTLKDGDAVRSTSK
jgi:RND family efflux transporter MFP subunit